MRVARFADYLGEISVTVLLGALALLFASAVTGVAPGTPPPGPPAPEITVTTR